MRRLALLSIGLFGLSVIAGCSYGGMATSADGKTVYIARNNAMFFGVGRRIYKCSSEGQRLNCLVMDGEP